MWDYSFRSKREQKTDKEIARIIMSRFQAGDTHLGKEFSIGGAYDYPVLTYVSKKALALIKKRGLKSRILPTGVLNGNFPKERKDGRIVKKDSLTKEHMIPIKEVLAHFQNLYDHKALSEAYIESFIKKLQIALICDEENDLLVQAGYNEVMPDGWWNGEKMDPLDRYRKAGLPDSIWVRDFQ